MRTGGLFVKSVSEGPSVVKSIRTVGRAGRTDTRAGLIKANNDQTIDQRRAFDQIRDGRSDHGSSASAQFTELPPHGAAVKAGGKFSYVENDP